MKCKWKVNGKNKKINSTGKGFLSNDFKKKIRILFLIELRSKNPGYCFLDSRLFTTQQLLRGGGEDPHTNHDPTLPIGPHNIVGINANPPAAIRKAQNVSAGHHSQNVATASWSAVAAPRYNTQTHLTEAKPLELDPCNSHCFEHCLQHWDLKTLNIYYNLKP